MTARITDAFLHARLADLERYPASCLLPAEQRELEMLAEIREHRARLARQQPEGRLSDDQIEDIRRGSDESLRLGRHAGHTLLNGEALSMALEIQHWRAGDLTSDDLRSIADTLAELGAYGFDPGEVEDARRPLIKILAAHGAKTP